MKNHPNVKNEALQLVLQFVNLGMPLPKAKECAIITVDRMIVLGNIVDHCPSRPIEKEGNMHFATYWTEVGEAIKK